MLVASYHDFGVQAVKAARSVLEKGGSALDAVEAGIRVIELDPSISSVGLSGLPNWLGEVELDAGIMDGDTLRACGVAAGKRVRNPISLARKCMELLPHVLIAGDSATRLAEWLGLEVVPSAKASPEALAERERMRERIERGDGDMLRYYRRLFETASKVWHDTIGVIAVDLKGSVAAGTSTSGVAFKFPGRVADSAVVGAGFYADSRWGAAICTGVGEAAMRISAAFRAVSLLKEGLTPQEAAERVIEAASEVSRFDNDAYRLGIVVASKREVGAAALNWRGFKVVYWYGGEIRVEEAVCVTNPI